MLASVAPFSPPGGFHFFHFRLVLRLELEDQTFYVFWFLHFLIVFLMLVFRGSPLFVYVAYDHGTYGRRKYC